MAERTPADLARDTLKLLATRRLPPTPANYQAIYEEVAGLLPQIAFPTAPLRRIANVLPTQTATQKRIAQDFAAAIETQDWVGLQAAIADYAQLDLSANSPLTPAIPDTAIQTIATLPTELATQLARLIENTVAALGEEDERMREMSLQLVSFLRLSPPPITSLEQMLQNYSYRLSFTAEDQAQRRSSIHALLHMVGEHVASMASHDQALQQQAQALASAMEHPWTLRQLDLIQTHLKNLLFRHLEIESDRNDAHQQLKELLGQHTLQMASLGKLSEHHASALTECAQQIQQAQDLGDLTSVLEAVVQSGSALAVENRVVQAQLADLRAQNEAQEQSIEKLSASLTLVSDASRHDPLTSALNLHGLHETLQTEAARHRRGAQSMSLAVLAIDSPPSLADNGNETCTTAALQHLARLIRSTLRPQDALGRISDCSFALIFPDTLPTQAAQALARLQTRLAQQPLLHAEHKVLLNFSAGVIAVSGLDTPAQAIGRAMSAYEQSRLLSGGRIAIV